VTRVTEVRRCNQRHFAASHIAGTIFETQSCNACHGDAGVGTAAGPALAGIAVKFTPEQLAELLKHPTAKMNAGGMPPIDLPPDDLKALISYLESLK
jgi:mono/diheme cytochrome c family protein